MNILLANWTWYPSGGDWTAVENLLKLYQQKGHVVIPFSMKDEKNYPTPYEKYFVEHIDYKELNRRKSFTNSIRVLRRSIYSRESREKLKQLLKEVKIDIAHLHNLGPQITPSIVLLLKEYQIPIIWTMHDYGLVCPNSTFVSNGKVCEKCKGGKYYQCTLNKCKKNSYRASLVASLRSYILDLLNVQKCIDVFICPSNFLMEKFLEYGFDQERLVHMYNPYDLSETGEMNTNDDVPYSNYILYVGRIEKVKGVFSLLKAFQNIKNVDLVIIGSGEEETACRDFIRSNNLSNVHFPGHMGKGAVFSFIWKSLFTVCPSECYENLPYSVVEAMLLGKPVIGSDMGGIPELVRDGYTGLTFKSGDITELKEKIENLTSDKERLQEYGDNARKHVTQMVNFEAHYQKMEIIFDKLMEN